MMSFSLYSMITRPLSKRVTSNAVPYKSTAVKRQQLLTQRLGSGMNRQQVRTVYSINKLTLLGHAGGEPTTHTFADGTSVTSFSLAVSENYTSKRTGEKIDRTDWFRVAVHNERLAEAVSKMVQKGSKVYVEGTLRPRKWTDATGTEKTSLEVLVRSKGEVVVLSRVGENEEQNPHSSHDSL